MNNQNTINDIRSKLNIVDIVSEYVPLTKKGQYYWGICPFHNDKNPSMSVELILAGAVTTVEMFLTLLNK